MTDLEMFQATANYMDGREAEKRRILAYLDELKKHGVKSASVDKMIKFVKGGDDGNDV